MAREHMTIYRASLDAAGTVVVLVASLPHWRQVTLLRVSGTALVGLSSSGLANDSFTLDATTSQVQLLVPPDTELYGVGSGGAATVVVIAGVLPPGAVGDAGSGVGRIAVGISASGKH